MSLNNFQTHITPLNKHKQPKLCLFSGGAFLSSKSKQEEICNNINQKTSMNLPRLCQYLCNLQRNLQPAIKDSTNPFVKNRYASLNSVMEVCKEPLLAHGIWLCQYPVQVENETSTGSCLGLMTKLTHAESGQWQSSLAVIPLLSYRYLG